MEKWFENRIKTVMQHNELKEEEIAVKGATENGHWTPIDLMLREYLNNGGGSAKGFLNLTRSECIKCYQYACENKQELIDLDMINKKAWNNFGFLLWDNYEFDR